MVRGSAPLGLLCLPHAGGGLGVFRPWIGAFGDAVEVIPARLPGREDLFREPPLSDLADMVAWVLDRYADALARPCAVMGHSMGALIAYSLARQLEDMGRSMPMLLVVAGYRPPHLPRTAPDLHRLPSDRFWRALGRYGGIDDAVLAEPELQRLVEPSLRADFQAVETYRHNPRGERLACPIMALAGTGDAFAAPSDMAQWRALTCRGFTQVDLQGDHFFPFSARATVVDALGPTLAAMAWQARDLC
jgi:surfactin synthase thioesterase subunit